jgi:Retroviral aspartyl protease
MQSDGLKKIVSSPPASVWAEGCIGTPCTTNEVRLNVSTLFSDSLTLLISSDSASGTTIKALIDSVSTHCFLDSNFVKQHNLHSSPIPPIPLRLFDGTANAVISESVDLPLRFPTGEIQTVSFHITPLDTSCSVVLGHNWLTRYNLLIDWALGRISFRSPLQAASNPTSPVALGAKSSSVSADSAPVGTPTPSIPDTLSVSKVNAPVFAQLSKLDGSPTFQVHLSDPIFLTARSASITLIDLSSVPMEYHDYSNVFSKFKAGSLADHWPYDLKINLKENSVPPIGPIYSLSQPELQALRNFIDENLETGFI